MANGFFLGGMAEGQATAQKQDLAERTLTQDTGLRTRALDLTERAQATAQQQANVTRVDKQIADTMSVVAETIKAAQESGKDPALVQKAVAPLVTSAKQLAGAVGRDPASLDAQVQALLVAPSAIDKAKVAGAAEGTKAVEKQKVLTEAGIDTLGSWKTLDEKVKAEGALRDDFVKISQPYIVVRDYNNNIKSLPKNTAEFTGADDIALIFGFMKIQDPTSAVLPGEAANAQNAGGVPEQIRATYNNLLGGGKLSKKVRDDLIRTSDGIYQKRAAQHDRITTQFANIAKRSRLSVDNVIVELSTPASPKAASGMQTTPGGTKFRIIP